MNTFAFLADQSPEWFLQPIPTKANLGHIPGEIGLEVSYKIKRLKGSSTGPSANQVVMFARLSATQMGFTRTTDSRLLKIFLDRTQRDVSANNSKIFWSFCSSGND
jgi:hypothetical protein